MKIPIIHNLDGSNVIRRRGISNHERIDPKVIRDLEDVLRGLGHDVLAVRGDRDLVAALDGFIPRECRALAFNLSYGIQGQARYAHVPSILEMLGVPYLAAGPTAHTLALDKVITKMVLREHHLPTPRSFVMDSASAPVEPLGYPVVVKPRHEADSLGLRLVSDETALREAVAFVVARFGQSALVEEFIDGAEVSVGVLGNERPTLFPPVLVDFGDHTSRIYTHEDKNGGSGRIIRHVCPAPIDAALARHAQQLALEAFRALDLRDCARVDMRIDTLSNVHILEINSLPSIEDGASYRSGAMGMGIDFPELVERLVDVASRRALDPAAPERHPETSATAAW